MQTQLKPTWTNKAYDFVMTRLREEGFEGYAVGGCVRDGLQGLSPKDVDVATNARPHDLPKIFGTKPWDGDNEVRTADNGVALYPTGVAHGTWTVRVGDDEVEVTTFRKDVATDGRRATVEFADTIFDDAQRRDFTMNALYMSPGGHIHDPTGQGVDDLFAGRVRFVGDAQERVKEDYLRIMRLFRFHAQFGRGPMEREAVDAACKHRVGLTSAVSGERVWDELKKLLSLHAPAEALWEMDAAGIVEQILGCRVPGVMGALFAEERKSRIEPDWLHRYSTLTQGSIPIPFPASNEERKRVEAAHNAVLAALDGPIPLAALSHKYGPEAATHVCLRNIRQYSARDIELGSGKEMPFSARDLMEVGLEPGPAIGKALAAAKNFWYATNLRATRDQLRIVALDELEHTDGS